MKARYFILAALTLAVFLTGCKNRFETYEPYSYFDERMAEAEKGSPYTPDDQMPPASDGDGQYASTDSQSFNNRVEDEPAQMAERRSSGGGGGSDIEVPFNSSRGEKHATNIGAL